MAGDVKTVYATGDGIIYAARTRVKAIVYSVTTPGAALILYDNASAASGGKLITLTTDTAGVFDIILPEQGILAENGVYVDINGAATITVIHG
tara:strand:- start:161 stop:439 length:279 start_codon:yes stop_codon:yes gene_type:complete